MTGEQGRIEAARKAATELFELMVSGPNQTGNRAWRVMQRIVHNLGVDAPEDEVLAVVREDLADLDQTALGMGKSEPFYIWRDDFEERAAVNERYEILLAGFRALVEDV